MSEAGPSSEGAPPITLLLQRVERGDDGARDELLGVVYGKLHGLASRVLGGRREESFPPTALVHEAYLRLFASPRPSFADHRHFFARAAKAMRTILIDGTRRRERGKRRSAGSRVVLDELLADYEARQIDLLAVEEALGKLAVLDPLMVQIVELKFFSRHTMEEIAAILDLPKRTVEREWTIAKSFLHRELEQDFHPRDDGAP